MCVASMNPKYNGHFYHINEAKSHEAKSHEAVSQALALLNWKLSTGSIPGTGVTLRVTSLLTSADVRIFRQIGSLPKWQQTKRRTYENGRAHSPKRGRAHSPGRRAAPSGCGAWFKIGNGAIVTCSNDGIVATWILWGSSSRLNDSDAGMSALSRLVSIPSTAFLSSNIFIHCATNLLFVCPL